MDPEETADITPTPVPEEVTPSETEVAPEDVTVAEPNAPVPDDSVPADVPTGDEDPVIDATDLVDRMPPAPALQVNGPLPLDSAIVINR